MTPTNPNRRAEIIDAAERRFASQGYLQTSVSEIIGDAGIAKGTFTTTSSLKNRSCTRSSTKTSRC